MYAKDNVIEKAGYSKLTCGKATNIVNEVFLKDNCGGIEITKITFYAI
jgi:hypothetical protein